MGNSLAREPAARDGGGDGEGAAVAQYWLSSYDVANATRIARRGPLARADVAALAAIAAKPRDGSDLPVTATRALAAPPGGGADGPAAAVTYAPVPDAVRAEIVFLRGLLGRLALGEPALASPSRAAGSGLAWSRHARTERYTAFQPSCGVGAPAHAQINNERGLSFYSRQGILDWVEAVLARDQRHALAPTLENAQRCGASAVGPAGAFSTRARARARHGRR